MQRDKIILIKGDNTKWYEQAIFIVKQNFPVGKMPVDFVSEAEKIINNYVAKEYPGYNTVTPAVKTTTVTKYKQPDQKAKTDWILNLVMLSGCVLLAVVLGIGFFG